MDSRYKDTQLPIVPVRNCREALNNPDSVVPWLIQPVESQFDLIAELPSSADSTTTTVTPSKASVYTTIREGKCEGRKAYFLTLCYYYLYDQAGLHLHDFPGVVIACRQLDDYSTFLGAIARRHYNLVLYRHQEKLGGLPPDRQTIVMTPKSHAPQYQYWSPDLIPHKNSMVYRKFGFEDMSDKKLWKLAQGVLQTGKMPVQTPDEWVDPRLNVYCQKNHPKIDGMDIWDTAGLAWYRPDILYELLMMAGRFEFLVDKREQVAVDLGSKEIQP